MKFLRNIYQFYTHTQALSFTNTKKTTSGTFFESHILLSFIVFYTLDSCYGLFCVRLDRSPEISFSYFISGIMERQKRHERNNFKQKSLAEKLWCWRDHFHFREQRFLFLQQLDSYMNQLLKTSIPFPYNQNRKYGIFFSLHMISAWPQWPSRRDLDLKKLLLYIVYNLHL